MQIALEPILSLLGRLGGWWISELAALLPDRLLTLGRSFAVLEWRNDEWLATVTQRGRAVLQGPLSDISIRKAIGERSDRSGQGRLNAHLHPPAADVLSRVVTVPSRILPQFARVLRLEADRWTPYDYEDVFIVWQRVGLLEAKPTTQVEIRFIQRSRVEIWCKELREQDIAPVRLVLGPLRSQSVPLKQRPTDQRTTLRTWVVPGVVVLAWAAALGVDVAVAVSNRAAWQARQAAEWQQFSVQRKIQDDITRTLAAIRESEVARANPKGALLASLSASLPRTDWLTELSIKGDTITLRGYALKVDDLTKALERFAPPGEVQYQGETSYDAKAERTRFTASFRLRRAAP